MTKISITCIVLLALCGCSRHYHPLEASQKAKLVSELISDAPQCSGYKQQLALPTSDDDNIDDIYRAATKAHCIKKDV